MNDVQLLAARMAKLEKQNRRLQVTLWVVTAVVAAVIGGVACTVPSSAQGRTTQSQHKVVEAEAFILKDANGVKRGEMSIDAEGKPEITLRDSEGKTRLQLKVHAKGNPSFVLHDSERKRRLGMYVNAKDIPIFALLDSEVKRRLQLKVNAEGEPYFSSFSETGEPVNQLRDE